MQNKQIKKTHLRYPFLLDWDCAFKCQEMFYYWNILRSKFPIYEIHFQITLYNCIYIQIKSFYFILFPFFWAIYHSKNISSGIFSLNNCSWNLLRCLIDQNYEPFHVFRKLTENKSLVFVLCSSTHKQYSFLDLY